MTATYSLHFSAKREASQRKAMNITHVLDTAIFMLISTGAAASALLGNTDAEDPMAAEMRLLLLPFIGASILSLAAIMFSPDPETRKVTIGRSLVALFIGTLAPQLIAAIHPSIANLSVKPVFLLMTGGCIAFITYILSKPFAQQFYERSERIARREAAKLEGRFSPNDKDDGNVILAILLSFVLAGFAVVALYSAFLHSTTPHETERNHSQATPAASRGTP